MAYNLLVVEDQRALREAIKILLEAHHFNVLAAATGNEALSIMENNCVDLILCDMSLPDISGHDVLKKVRVSENLKYKPFIFLTAYADAAEIKTAMDEGADDYITKPFSTKDLVRTINEKLETFSNA
jgi:CheY-like chemotaxis protein